MSFQFSLLVAPVTLDQIKDFRTDELVVPEFLELPLEDGTRIRYNLVSFAVYHPGHYIAYGKSFPSREWFCYNDETVTKPTVEEVVHELSKTRRDAFLRSSE